MASQYPAKSAALTEGYAVEQRSHHSFPERGGTDRFSRSAMTELTSVIWEHSATYRCNHVSVHSFAATELGMKFANPLIIPAVTSDKSEPGIFLL